MQEWELNYEWERRLKRRDLAPLRGEITTSKPSEVAEQIQKRIEDGGVQDHITIDGHKFNAWFNGGCIFKPLEVTESGVVVTMLSSGEDCFDSLKYYSDEVCRIVPKTDPQAKVVWTELPFSRSDIH